MGFIKFFKELFGSKKTKDCCNTPESCSTPEVCKVEVLTEVPTKVEVPTVEPKAKVEKKEVNVISEKLAEVADKKVTVKDIKGKKKSEFPIEAPVAEVTPEKKSKPRRRRKPKPKNDEGNS